MKDEFAAAGRCVDTLLQALEPDPPRLYLLPYIDDETYRSYEAYARRILVQLNRHEGRHALARDCFTVGGANCVSGIGRDRRISWERWAWW